MAWLIRERARLKGEIEKIDRQLEQLPRTRVGHVQALAALGHVIPLHKAVVGDGPASSINGSVRDNKPGADMPKNRDYTLAQDITRRQRSPNPHDSRRR